MSEIYGKLDSEKLAEEKLVCRKILKEINNFGISERQKLFLMYIMSLELETTQARQDISLITKEHLNDFGGVLSTTSEE